MIITLPVGHLEDYQLTDSFIIDYVRIKSDDLTKKIMRVTTDAGTTYGIDFSQSDAVLEDGLILSDQDGVLVVVQTVPENVIVIKPKTIDEMGITAHLLGNSHKPIEVENGEIILQYDPVIEEILKNSHIAYSLKELSLKKALRHANFAHSH